MGLDHAKLKQTRAGARAGSGWKTRVGENRVRILPPHSSYLDKWEELENLAIPFKMHFFKIEGRPNDASLCLEELKQRCPACDMWRIHRKSDDPGLAQMAKQIAPADQYLFNMIDIGNVAGGIQRWSANWTCWDKILEIAGNPAWGNVADPAAGVNFLVNMTPGSETRSGYNAYSVMPEPDRTSILAILDTIENWKAALDILDQQKAAPKEAEEIKGLLAEIGFPGLDSPAPSAAATAAAPALTPPATAATPQPVVVQPTTAAPPAAPAAPAAPVEVQPTPQPVVVEQPAAPAAPAAAEAAAPAAAAIHYDPGPTYVPKMTDEKRPAGAPRCYGDYLPQTHRCAPCPVMTGCQVEMLGVEE